MSTVLTMLGSATGVFARPATVFIPHMALIENNIPVGLAMRLPTEIPLSGPSDFEESKLVVRVFPSETLESFTVSIFTCESSTHPCLLGSFAVYKRTNDSAQRDLERHQAIGDRIPLATNIKGYLIEGPRQNPSYQFSTLMWQQNNMVYTISFPANERENIVWMATSMVREQPLYRSTSRSISSR